MQWLPFNRNVVSSNPAQYCEYTLYNTMWYRLSMTCDRSLVFSLYSMQHYVITIFNYLRNVSGFFFLCTIYSILFVIKFVNNLRNIYVFFLLCTLYNIRWYSLSMICGRSLVFSVYSVQHYVILFVNDLRKVSCFFQCNLYSIIW